MMMHARSIRSVLGAAALTLATMQGAWAATTTTTSSSSSSVVDCDKIYAVDHRETYRVDEASVHQCLLRGWDPPITWKRDQGKSAGVRVSGSGGFAYGSIQAPKDSPGKLRVRASVKGSVITSTCNFPPRIKISISGGTPSVKFPPGSCYDFLNDLFKDKDDATNSTPIPPGADDSSCPAESDNTGIFGVKQPLGGGSTGYTCGGMVPMTTTDVVLNANPDSLVTTEEGSPYLWSYRRGGANFTPTLSGARLPTYLCTLQRAGESDVWVKTVDLTPPTAQMITYNGSTGEINIRLQPRETMNPNFIPPYDENAPEKYLVIPVDGAGVPQIPADCADEATYFREPTGREDILIRANTNSGCEGVGVQGTNSNQYYFSCDGIGGTLSGTICVDGNGDKIDDAKTVDNWVTTCPNGGAPVSGVCPETNGIPPEAACGAAAAAGTVGASCDTMTLTPKATTGGACENKLQYSVLDRPNLYYPPGISSTLYPISGRTAMMASTSGATIYTQGSTTFFLQPTAPKLRFNDGGLIKLDNGDTLIMNPPAIISGGSSVTLPKGGQLVSPGGTQKLSYSDGSTAGIPSSSRAIMVNTGRSVDLAPEYLYPTAPKVGSEAPYVRLPVETPPKE